MPATYIRNVVPREQNLGHGLSKVTKQVVPQADQPALTDGRQGLKRRQVLWSVIHLHPQQADADGAGRHDDDAVAILSQLDGRLDDERQDGQQRLVRGLVDDGAGS